MADRSLGSPASQAVVDVSKLLDEGRWTGYQKWLVLMTALTILFDGIDNQLLGIALPSIIRDWGVARGAFSPVVSLGYLGMAIGGWLGGMAGDRIGRRVTLLSCMMWFGVATLAISFASGIPSLAFVRMLAGLGLGGAMPNAAALSSEYVPQRKRPLAVTLTIVCIPLGGALAGLLAVPALPAFGWRGLFAIGGVAPIVVALFLWRLLPESPRHLTHDPARWQEIRRTLRRMGHTIDDDTAVAEISEKPVERVSLGALFQSDFRRDTLALWGAFFTSLLTVYLVFSWLPSILASAGLGSTVASTSITIFNMCGVVGAVVGGMIIGRFGSKTPMLLMAVGAVLGALVLSAMNIGAQSSVWQIFLMLGITGGLLNAVQTTMFALAAHVYPTNMRATGVGAANAIGRVGAIFSGYAGPWALEFKGSTSFFGLMAVAVSITLISLTLVGRHVRPASR